MSWLLNHRKIKVGIEPFYPVLFGLFTSLTHFTKLHPSPTRLKMTRRFSTLQASQFSATIYLARSLQFGAGSAPTSIIFNVYFCVGKPGRGLIQGSKLTSIWFQCWWNSEEQLILIWTTHWNFLDILQERYNAMAMQTCWMQLATSSKAGPTHNLLRPWFYNKLMTPSIILAIHMSFSTLRKPFIYQSSLFKRHFFCPSF